MIPIGRCDLCQVPMFQGREHICGGDEGATYDAVARRSAEELALILRVAMPVAVHWHPELPGAEWTTVQVRSLSELERWNNRVGRPGAIRVEWIGHELSDGTWDVTRHHGFETPWHGPGLLRVVFLETRQAVANAVATLVVLNQPDNRSPR